MRNVNQWFWPAALAVMSIFSCAKLGPERQWANARDPLGTNFHGPTVSAPKDTTIAINDSIVMQASGFDSNGSVVIYQWSLDHGRTWNLQSGPDGRLRYAWDLVNSGRQVVWVRSIDNDGLESAPDSCTVTVHKYLPAVSHIKDTVVSQKASVAVAFVAFDTNGAINSYFWRIDTAGVAARWTDSSVSPGRVFSRAGGGPLRIIWGARDHDGNITADSFTILFNRGPTMVAMLNPKDSATGKFSAYDYTKETGSMRLGFLAQDPDGKADTLTYQLFLGLDPDSIVKIWSGRDTAYASSDFFPTTRYFWKLTAKDLFGDSVVSRGSFSTSPSPSGPSGMVLIRSAGKPFAMGVAGGEPYETPVHQVTISYNFWMDTTEVTQEDFRALLDNTLSSTGLPVAKVNWFDAVLYCNARSRRDKKDTVYAYTAVRGTPGKNCTIDSVWLNRSASGYRLPTEAEWEFACRAGSSHFYFWGDGRQQADPYCWYRENSGSAAHPVARKKASPYHLYDIAGNVWEWCNDWFNDDYYQKSAASDPAGPASGVERVIRGGSWQHSDAFAGSGVRSKLGPSLSNDAVGFRAVLQYH